MGSSNLPKANQINRPIRMTDTITQHINLTDTIEYPLGDIPEDDINADDHKLLAKDICIDDNQFYDTREHGHINVTVEAIKPRRLLNINNHSLLLINRSRNNVSKV